MCLQYYLNLHAFIFTVNINKQGFFVSDYLKDLGNLEMVHLKITILSSFTHPCVVPNLSSVNTKEDILKNVSTK